MNFGENAFQDAIPTIVGNDDNNGAYEIQKNACCASIKLRENEESRD